MKQVRAFTDGACSGNPGPGGWGALLQFGDHERELNGGAHGRLRLRNTRNGGGVLQVVYAQKKDTQTIPSPTAGADIDISGLSFTIKPSRSSSLILLQATIHHFVDGGNQMGFILKANKVFYGEFSNSKINSGLLQREIYIRRINKDEDTEEVSSCRLDEI